MKKIEQALLERTPEDLVYIGQIAEKFYNSPAGDLLRAVANGFQSSEIKRHEHDNKTNSDLKMGRIEGIQMMVDSFEEMIAQKKQLEAEIKESNTFRQGDV